MANRKDVAREAGVSTTTVSYYMNDSGYVGKSARIKIAEAIEKLDYRPNLLAKSLKHHDSKQIVYICNEIRNPFHSEIAYGLSEISYKKGYRTMFCTAFSDEEYILNTCDYMVSGIFIASGQISTATIDKIVKLGAPVVLFENRDQKDLNEKVKRIRLDFEPCFRTLLGDLQRRGITTLGAVVAGAVGRKLDQKTETLLELSPEYGVNMLDKFIIGKVDDTKNAFDFALEKFKTEKEIPQAIFCGNDVTAIGVLRAALDFGLRVPEDLSIIGMDNTIFSQNSAPRLSSIDTFPEKIGEKAFEMLLDRGEDCETIFTLTPEFVKRESS